jgi:hypothetical protein
VRACKRLFVSEVIPVCVLSRCSSFYILTQVPIICMKEYHVKDKDITQLL